MTPPPSSRPSRSGAARGAAATCAVALAVAGTLAGSGCGGQPSAAADAVRGDVLRVYASVPDRGPLAAAGRDVVAAQRLALAQAHGRVGRFRVAYVARDDSEPRAGGWTPRQVAANARLAAQDPHTIAYLGELDTGGSAVSLPILNGAGILQVSPGDTVAGLTRNDGTGVGGPLKYLPSGHRTFARVVPDDDVQAAALVADLRAHGVRRLYVVGDERLYGESLAARVALIAPRRGVRVIATRAIDPLATDFRSLARDARAARVDGVLYAATSSERPLAFARALAAVDPQVTLIGPNALVHPAFYARLDASSPRVLLTSPLLPWRLYPGAARSFRRAFTARYGRAPRTEAIYGYAAMQLVLAALTEAGGRADRRAAVIRAALAHHPRSSALGAYALDGHGDTTRVPYAAYRVVGGRLEFERLIG